MRADPTAPSPPPDVDGIEGAVIEALSAWWNWEHGEMRDETAIQILMQKLEMHVGKSGHTAGCTRLEAFGCSERCRKTIEAITIGRQQLATPREPVR